MLNTNECREAQCPIQYTLDIIGSKWSVLILRELFSGDRRTHEFLTALPGISTKTLTQRLRELEEHGLVNRRVYAEIPPRVEYSLTAKGCEIQPVLDLLHQVGTRWLQQDNCDCPLQTNHKGEPDINTNDQGSSAASTSTQLPVVGSQFCT